MSDTPIQQTSPLFVLMRLLRGGGLGPLDPADRLVAVAIADRARWEDGEMVAWPSLGDLVVTTGMSRTTVYRALTRLQEAGVVRSEATGRASRFVLLVGSERFQNETSEVSGRHLRGFKLKPPVKPQRFQNDTSEVSGRHLRGFKLARDKEEAPIEAPTEPPNEAPTNPPTPPAGAGGRSREARLRAERDALLEHAAEQGLELPVSAPRVLLKRLRAGAQTAVLRAELDRDAQHRKERVREEAQCVRQLQQATTNLERLDAMRAQPERAAETWALIAAEIGRQLNRHSYATWFRPLEAFDLRGGRLYLRVPNAQFAEWVGKNYARVIAQAVVACGLTCAVEACTVERLAELLQEQSEERGPPRVARAG